MSKVWLRAGSPQISTFKFTTEQKQNFTIASYIHAALKKKKENRHWFAKYSFGQCEPVKTLPRSQYCIQIAHMSHLVILRWNQIGYKFFCNIFDRTYFFVRFHPDTILSSKENSRLTYWTLNLLHEPVVRYKLWPLIFFFNHQGKNYSIQGKIEPLVLHLLAQTIYLMKILHIPINILNNKTKCFRLSIRLITFFKVALS